MLIFVQIIARNVVYDEMNISFDYFMNVVTTHLVLIRCICKYKDMKVVTVYHFNEKKKIDVILWEH